MLITMSQHVSTLTDNELINELLALQSESYEDYHSRRHAIETEVFLRLGNHTPDPTPRIVRLHARSYTQQVTDLVAHRRDLLVDHSSDAYPVML